jgi:hypothetical protein
MENKVLSGLKQIGESLKVLFAAIDKPVQVAAKFEDYTLQDGTTVISVDKLEVGGVVTVAGAPAPDAVHTLQDGSTLTTVGGLITEYVPYKAVDDNSLSTIEDFKKAMQKFAIGTPEERIAKLETIVKGLVEYNFGWELREADRKASIDGALAAYKQGFEAQQKAKDEALKTSLTQLFETVKQIGEQPIVEPQKQQNEPLTAWQKFKAETGQI